MLNIIDSHPALCLAYMGPGVGLTLFGSVAAFGMMLLSSFLMVITWPVWQLIKRFKKHPPEASSAAKGEGA